MPTSMIALWSPIAASRHSHRADVMTVVLRSLRHTTLTTSDGTQWFRRTGPLYTTEMQLRWSMGRRHRFWNKMYSFHWLCTEFLLIKLTKFNNHYDLREKNLHGPNAAALFSSCVSNAWPLDLLPSAFPYGLCGPFCAAHFVWTFSADRSIRVHGVWNAAATRGMCFLFFDSLQEVTKFFVPF